ncbi:MAG: radical SAM family heme chaperone HemW [Candidatus Babeliales bacterium]|jgi:oxygen-independent coproporphyrinogen-3 oxidase
MKPFPQHFYIHWPFCHLKCAFCDFVAFQNHEHYQEAYCKRLCQEIVTFCAQYPAADRLLTTIFIGGGTPSMCPLPLFERIMQTIYQETDCSAVSEITIETNPSDITDQRLAAWRKLGINRLSIGVQCLDDDVLEKLNRKQRVSDVERALSLAPSYFNNISVDLILGLPGIREDAWKDTIAKVVTWPIKHISVYFLMVHEKTPLAFALKKGDLSLLSDNTQVRIYEWTVKMLEQHGFEQYEISNFSRSGCASVHNSAYWDRRPYQGFGVGAASFDGAIRSINTNNLSAYLAADSAMPPCTREVLTPQQEFMEVLMLSLRQKRGIDLQHMVYFLNDCQNLGFKSKIADLVAAGLMEEHQGFVRLTLKGMALENEVVVWLSSL